MPHFLLKTLALSFRSSHRRQELAAGAVIAAALAIMPAASWANGGQTVSMGWLIRDDQQHQGQYEVDIIYGNYRENFDADGGMTVLGALYAELNPFASIQGFTNVQNGVLPDGLTLGVNYFFPNKVTLAENDFSTVPDQQGVRNFASVTFVGLLSGSYTYEAVALEDIWDVSDAVMAQGGFSISQAGVLSFLGAPALPDIDTDQTEYTVDDLNNSQVNPVFSGGTLSVGSSGTVTPNFTVTGNNGTINTNANTTTFSGNFSGDGQITKTGTGTLNLTGTNSNAGGFSVNQGTLSANSAGALGNGPLTLNGGTFLPTADMFLFNQLVIGPNGGTFNTGGQTVIALTGINGDGPFIMTGSGILHIGAPFPIANVAANRDPFQIPIENIFDGEIQIEQGALYIHETVTGTQIIDVGANGTFGGKGSISGQVTIHNGGTLAPGASPGVLTVAGDVTQLPGSTFAADIDGPTAGNGAGHHDQLVLTGTGVYTADGTIAPQLRGITAPANNDFTPSIGDSFQVVEAAGGVQGAFDRIIQPTDGLPFNSRFDVAYGANSVMLMLTSASLAEAARIYGKQNAVAAGQALDTIRPWPVTGTAASDRLFLNLQSVPRVQTAVLLHQLSGEIYASTKHAGREANRFLRDSTIRTLVSKEASRAAPLDPFSLTQLDPGSMSHEMADDSALSEIGSLTLLGTALDMSFRPHGVWFSGIGQFGKVSENTVGSSFKTKYQGLTGGIDLYEGDRFVAGIGIGHMSGDVDTAILEDADFTSQSIFGYSHGTVDGVIVTGSVGGTYSRYDVERDVAFAIGPQLGDEYDGLMFHADLEARRPMPLAHQLTLSPMAGLRSEIGWTSDIAESGDPSVALLGDDELALSFQLRLGAELAAQWMLFERPAKSWLAGAVLIDGGPDRVATADVSLFGAEWTAASPADDMYAGLFEAGIAVELDDDTQLMADYGANFSEDSHRHQFRARISKRW